MKFWLRMCRDVSKGSKRGCVSAFLYVAEAFSHLLSRTRSLLVNFRAPVYELIKCLFLCMSTLLLLHLFCIYACCVCVCARVRMCVRERTAEPKPWALQRFSHGSGTIYCTCSVIFRLATHRWQMACPAPLNITTRAAHTIACYLLKCAKCIIYVQCTKLNGCNAMRFQPVFFIFL